MPSVPFPSLPNPNANYKVILATLTEYGTGTSPAAVADGAPRKSPQHQGMAAGAAASAGSGASAHAYGEGQTGSTTAAGGADE